MTALEAAAEALRDIKHRRPTFDEQAQAAITAFLSAQDLGEYEETVGKLRRSGGGLKNFEAESRRATAAIEALVAERDKFRELKNRLAVNVVTGRLRAEAAEARAKSAASTLSYCLQGLIYRQTGSDPKTNGYAYAELPEWQIRQLIELLEGNKTPAASGSAA